MTRKIFIHSASLTVMAALVVGIAIVRAGRREPPVPAPNSKIAASKPITAPTSQPVLETARQKPESNPEKLSAALHDSTLKSLIQNAKVAELRGDAKTRDAMVRGLKKNPERSHELILQEISSSRDAVSASALRKLAEALQ